jgi:hypothetical protein
LSVKKPCRYWLLDFFFVIWGLRYNCLYEKLAKANYCVPNTAGLYIKCI